MSLGMGVCGSGDKEIGRGDVGVDAGSSEVESPRVIVYQKGASGRKCGGVPRIQEGP
jgi:hypothetical protein